MVSGRSVFVRHGDAENFLVRSLFGFCATFVAQVYIGFRDVEFPGKGIAHYFDLVLPGM